MIRYKYPDFDPYSNFEDVCWFIIKPKEIIGVNVNPKGTHGSFITSEPTEELYFMLPKTFSISVQHEWKEYSTIAGAIRELGVKVYNGLGQAAALYSKAMESGISNTPKTSIPVDSINTKNDNPVKYENSSRKMLNIELSLSCYKDAKKDVFDPIQKLLELSSPDIQSQSSSGVGLVLAQVKYRYPYIFDISIADSTGKTTMFSIKNAILSQINPEYQYPYINGYPSRGSVNLSFEDADPLYRTHSWEEVKGEPVVSTMEVGGYDDKVVGASYDINDMGPYRVDSRTKGYRDVMGASSDDKRFYD